MKFPRVLAIALILVMVSGQAFAAACATACSMSDIQASTSKAMQHMEGMSAKDCQHSMPSKDDHRSSHQATGCNMAGCHLTQVATIERTTAQQVYAISGTVLALRNPIAVSADLPPPIKPPA